MSTTKRIAFQGKPQPKQRAANRCAFTAHLPRIEENIEPENLFCSYGGGLHYIGEDLPPHSSASSSFTAQKYACQPCMDCVAQARALHY
ncbi:hypothetical protein [Rhizobium sp. P44RR-XXIV]|uniref:hypothetical protein n=1 Tax=Rhizobium sp. P44RR-XXIV TaxID=1921145 RepID=UPI0010A9AD51|nr:hypothetical protein [Rhizobium sp. P44RR-XXIV]TIX89352.1 hypothetical protein BSK43_022475 [Rhizobium sp. P44RR-XXIV]